MRVSRYNTHKYLEKITFLLVFELKENHCNLPSESFRDAVNGITIQHTCKKIERHSGTETTARSNGRKSANEIHAMHVEQSVEIVILRYEDLIAVRILQVWRPAAAFFRVVSVQGVCKCDDRYITMAESDSAFLLRTLHTYSACGEPNGISVFAIEWNITNVRLFLSRLS